MGLFGPPNIEKMKAKKDVKGLIKALGYKKDSSVCETAAKALVSIGESAVEPLIAALERTSWDVRWRAVRTLGKIGNQRAIKPLIDVLKDPTVCSEAVEALGRIGKPATDSLIAVLKDESQYWFVREAAAKKLRKIGDGSTVKRLEAMLKDKDETKRAAAAIALRRTCDASAIEQFVAMLKSKDSEIRLSAAKELDRLGWKPDSKEDKAWYLAAKEYWDKCINIGAPAAMPLANALHALYNANECRKICHALISIGKTGTEPALIKALEYVFPFKKGDWFNKELAECYLNSGNKRLADAAGHWASRHSFDIARRNGLTSGPEWGEGANISEGT